MTWRTHQIAGITAGLTVASCLPTIAAKGVVLVGASVGALFPDIDHANSKISNKIPVLPTFINMIFGHRGFIHSPLFYCPVIILFLIMPDTLLKLGLLGFLLGVFSHLILDSCNPSGIPWLYPFTKRKFHVLKIETGSSGEIVFDLLLTILLAVIII